MKQLLDLRQQAGQYRLVNLRKQGEGMEGERWEARLMRNDKLIGTVNEDGHGGPLRLFISDREEMALLTQHAKVSPEAGQYEPVEDFIGITLLGLYDLERQLKRAAKGGKATLIAVEGDDCYLTYPVPADDPRTPAAMNRKYGEGKWTLVNALL